MVLCNFEILLLLLVSSAHSSVFRDLVSGIDYNRDARPYVNVQPVTIYNHFILTSLGPINEQDMTFEIGFYHRQWWNDPRLVGNATRPLITSNFHPKDYIWIPDLYIVNDREVDYKNSFTRTIIKHDGNIYFSYKVKAKCGCDMNLRNYPMDEQHCVLKMESYAFSIQHVIIDWKADERVHMASKENEFLTGFELLNISRESKITRYGEVDDDSLKFWNILMHIYVKRNSVYFAYKAFIPSVLLSIFNIGSYWIPDKAMPARVTLIITTFLANMLILQSITEQTIKVSYTTAMQLFLLVNLIFLVSAIVQYIIVLSLKIMVTEKSSMRENESFENKNTKGQSVRIGEKQTNGGGDVEGNDGADAKNNESIHKIMEKYFLLSKKNEDEVHVLDKVFRILAPVIYSIFLIIYFVYYNCM